MTVLGSVANLIIVEQARKGGVAVGLWDYCRVGVPVTVLTLLVGAGRLAFEGRLEELRARGAARIQVRTADAQLAETVLTDLELADIQAGDGHVSARLGDQPPEDICARLVHAGVRVAGFDTPRPSLEDLFVELTGEGFNVDH